MNYLIGDIGNTSIKLSILNDRFGIKKIYNFETKKIFDKKERVRFLRKIANKNLNKKILFSSVVPKALIEIKKYLSKKKI